MQCFIPFAERVMIHRIKAFIRIGVPDMNFSNVKLLADPLRMVSALRRILFQLIKDMPMDNLLMEGENGIGMPTHCYKLAADQGDSDGQWR